MFRATRSPPRKAATGVIFMARDLLLWLIGVPISVIVLLHVFGVLHW
jgi:hypothetical protein